MPIYEMMCKECDTVQDVWASMSEYDAGLKCDCGHPLTRVFITPATVHGAIPSDWKLTGKQQSRLPVNIIDEKPGGGYKVTRIGQKKDIEND